MPTEYSGWVMKDKNDYGIRFETNDYELYKLVEETCRKAVEIAGEREMQKRKYYFSYSIS